MLKGKALTRMATLKRRMGHLRSRIEEGIIEGRELTYDQEEYSALKWVIERVEKTEGDEDAGHQDSHERSARSRA